MSNPNSTQDTTMRHAKLTYPKATVHRTHPFKNPDNHESLLQYLRQRLIVGKKGRDDELPRLVKIDRKVSGWIRLSAEDRRRQAKNESDGQAQMTAINLPLAFIHLDDMMTYYAQTFAPNRGMFYHTAKPGEVTESSQIVTKMNNDAIYSGYFREVLAGIFSLLKYNMGGFYVEWGSEQGPKIVETQQGTRVDSELKWQGNRLKALDRYNFLCDRSVAPHKLHVDGEFAAKVEVRSRFWLQNKASQGAFFNCEEAVSGDCTYGGQTKYYRSPPAETMLNQSNGTGNDDGQTNWVALLSESNGSDMVGGHELVTIHIRLNPTEFGLVEGKQPLRNRYEIWRFTILDDQWIIDAQFMNNIHDHLPYYLGLVHDDAIGSSQKSVGELLEPLQDFASSLLNIHIAASRSALWGVTFYDPTVVDFKKVPKGEVAAHVPIEPTGYGKDVSAAIWQHNSGLETQQTMKDLESVMGIINQFFPTQSLPSQIASIDRAVTDQVAAVQQGANRRQQKTARLLDDTIFRNIRFSMYYNIIQFQPDGEEITDFYTGKPIKLDLASLRNTNLPFIIGQGLKALDRAAAVQNMQQIIFALIQAPQAAQGIDLLAMIDYWTSMFDLDIDMKQFRLPPPQAEGAPPQIDPATGQPIAAAAASGIQPATAPAQIAGGPIYD